MFSKKIKLSKVLTAASAVLVTTAVILGGCTPSGNLASQEKAEVTEAPTATPTTAPTSTPTPIPTFTPTPMLSVSPTPIPATTAAVTPTPGAQNIYYATAGVNVRSEASTDGEVLGTLDPGDKITVLEMVDDDWAKIQYKEKTGYVSRKYIVSEADYDPSKYADDDDDDSKSEDEDSEEKPYGDMTEEEYEELQKARAAAMINGAQGEESSGTDGESGDSTSETTNTDTGSDDADDDGGSDDGEAEDTIDDTEDDGGSDEDVDTGEVFDEEG